MHPTQFIWNKNYFKLAIFLTEFSKITINMKHEVKQFQNVVCELASTFLRFKCGKVISIWPKGKFKTIAMATKWKVNRDGALSPAVFQQMVFQWFRGTTCYEVRRLWEYQDIFLIKRRFLLTCQYSNCRPRLMCSIATWYRHYNDVIMGTIAP